MLQLLAGALWSLSGGHMHKRSRLTLIASRATAGSLTAAAITLLIALAMPAPLIAQVQPHYKLIDLGTLGGPDSSVDFAGFPLNALNGQGVLAACSDTSTPDPNYPNSNPLIPPGSFGLPLPDPLIFHTFQWINGKLTDLGALPGVNSSCATYISSNALIAGESENGTLDPINGWPEVQAVLWRRGQIRNLGTLGGNESVATGVNNQGQVVGLATIDAPDSLSFPGLGQQTRAFLWEHGTMRDLGTLGGPDAYAIGINDRGQVLGFSFVNSTLNPTTGLPTGDGFLWENGVITDIPNPLGGTLVTPIYLSDKGQVVGYANLKGDMPGQEHPFLWQNSVFTDLTSFGGTGGAAAKINDAGQIVGNANFAGSTTYHAAIWQNGSIFDLGTLGSDDCSAGLDINSLGQTVGFSAACVGTTSEAFVWQNGGPMVDLNTLIPANTGLHLQIAANINDLGEIAGSGMLANGDIHAFLLIPCAGGTECQPDAGSNLPAITSSSPQQSVQSVQKLLAQRYGRSWMSRYRNLR
jgi:probable HAF family extracellular repeat protein